MNDELSRVDDDIQERDGSAAATNARLATSGYLICVLAINSQATVSTIATPASLYVDRFIKLSINVNASSPESAPGTRVSIDTVGAIWPGLKAAGWRNQNEAKPKSDGKANTDCQFGLTIASNNHSVFSSWLEARILSADLTNESFRRVLLNIPA